MTSHELAKKLLKSPDIRICVIYPNIGVTNIMEDVEYSILSTTDDGKDAAIILRGTSYKDEVMKSNQTTTAKNNLLQSSIL